MARVEVTAEARRALREMIATHNLPADSLSRIRRSLRRLEDFPELGAPLRGDFGEQRFLLGPWRWMIIVYRYRSEDQVVVIRGFFDGRSSTSPIANG